MSNKNSPKIKTPFPDDEWSFRCLEAFLPPIRQTMGGWFKFGDFLFINIPL